MKIIDRIKEIIKYKGISTRKFCMEIGVANGFFDKVRDVGTEKALKILNRYPDISPEWLITGKGAMLREASAGKPQTATVAAPAAMPERAPAAAEAVIYKEILDKKDSEIRELNREIGALQHENTALKQQVADLLQERADNKKNSATKHDAAQLAVPDQLHTRPYPEILMAAEPMKPYKRNQRAP